MAIPPITPNARVTSQWCGHQYLLGSFAIHRPNGEQEGKTFIYTKTYTFPILDENTDEVISYSPFTIESLNADNPYKIGYDWLKENDLSGSIDILE